MSKLGAIGVRVAGGVTTHGFALNCSNDLAPYSRIVACGIRDAGVTTLTEVLGRRVEPIDVLAAVMSRFESPADRHARLSESSPAGGIAAATVMAAAATAATAAATAADGAGATAGGASSALADRAGATAGGAASALAGVVL